MVAASMPHPSLAIATGTLLSEEPGLGALTIPAYAREVTSRFADREALVMHAFGAVERWTYATLWERSVDVAKSLIACGVNKDSRVGILMANRPEYLAAIFGTALAGGVAVPLSTFSTPSELDYLLKTSAVSVLLFDRRVLQQDFQAMLQAESETRFPFLRHRVMLPSVTEREEHKPTSDGGIESWSAFLARGVAVEDSLVDARADSVKSADLGALFFSSGTTSLPKGILHTQRAICIQWWRWPRVMGVEGPVRSWTGNGFFWAANLSLVIGIALSTGGSVVLQPTFQAEQALELMQKERVSMPVGRPHQWARLQAAPNWQSADLSSLRYIDRRMTLAQHPTVKTQWQLPPSYGNTETLTISTCSPNVPSRTQAGVGHGEPLPGNTIKIIDPLGGAVLARGQRGEVAVKGATLMTSYVGKHREEALDDEGFFHTGDGGYLDDAGRLFWEGRLTDIIKTGGANVSPLEVDAALVTFPGVKIAQTVGVPHDTLGEMVVSCLVPVESTSLDEAQIRAQLKERLASYKIPRRVLFFNESELQVTGNGKVKTAELRELVARRLGLSTSVPADG
ncbi:MAG TPA: class I adenylate-forming enzyme family protein [Steroidobacter sp.]